MSEGFYHVLDIVLAVYGLYVSYTAIMMKKTGTIDEKNVLIGKNVDLKHSPDIPGFIENMWLKSTILGILVAISSGLCVLNYYYPYSDIIEQICSVVMIILVFAYGALLTQAQKKYLKRI